MSKKHIVSTVFNSVENDSRVIKTAQAAISAGYDATIVGVCSGSEIIRKEVEGVPVVLVPNFSQQLKRYKLWGPDNRDLRLLIGGQLRTTIPEIVSLEPDIIHSHDMVGLKIGAAVSRALLIGGHDVPWVHDIHEFVAGLKGELAELYMPICLAWEREHLRTADQLITVSETLADEVQSRYFLPNKPTVTYNAPPRESYSKTANDIRSHLGLAVDVPLIVFVGGATPLRGCDTILKSLAYLDGVHLAFVSQGKYVEELIQLAEHMNISERFHVHPYVSSDQVTSFIRTADIGIHGLVHYPNAEVAMPNKMFEYLQAGLPMVVSDVASMKEFVKKHHIGDVFLAGDPVSCSDAIKRVLNARDEFSNNITVDLKELFSWEEQAKKIKHIYKDLLTEEITLPDSSEINNAVLTEKLDTLIFETSYSQSLSMSNFEKINNLESLTLIKHNETKKQFSSFESRISKKLSANKSKLLKLELELKRKNGTFYQYFIKKISLIRKHGFFASLTILFKRAKKKFSLVGK